MNLVDKLEKMLADRRWNVEGVDERLAFDALPALLAVVRATQNMDTRCLYRYRADPCGSCVMCVLHATLAPLIAPQPCQHVYHTAPVQCLDYKERDKLNATEDRIHQTACTAAWDELEALLDKNEQRHRLAAEDPYRIPENHTFEAEQWAAVRRLLALSAGVEPESPA